MQKNAHVIRALLIPFHKVNAFGASAPKSGKNTRKPGSPSPPRPHHTSGRVLTDTQVGRLAWYLCQCIMGKLPGVWLLQLSIPVLG